MKKKTTKQSSARLRKQRKTHINAALSALNKEITVLVKSARKDQLRQALSALDLAYMNLSELAEQIEEMASDLSAQIYEEGK